MNIAFGSPIEALALDYLTFAFSSAFNNIWTWVAVVTGALSFLISIRKPSISFPRPISPAPYVHSLGLQAPEPDTTEDELAQSPEPDTASEVFDWTTRKKFTVYYENDGEEIVGQASNKVNELSLNRNANEWEWEGMLRMRILNGYEMGWYRYQDLSVLNGNVVRLWERN